MWLVRKTAFVDGKEVPYRYWQVDFANMSEPSLARCMRGLLACGGLISDSFGVGGRRSGYVDDWRGSFLLMVALPDGFLARFREVAKPYEVRPPTRIQVGTRGYACELPGCLERCPPSHHGGTEWRAVDAENGVRS